jgi:hypothetical protein
MKTCLQIGIIGGTGLDDPDILENRKEISVATPFGSPSDVLIEGKISGVSCSLLARYKLCVYADVSQLVSVEYFFGKSSFLCRLNYSFVYVFVKAKLF